MVYVCAPPPRLRAAVISLILLNFCFLASAAEPSSRVVDKRKGEQAQIERRREWFLSTRVAGTSSPAERALLRRVAADEVAGTIERQRARRSRGLLAEENFWVSVGPAASRFGGWAFGEVSGRITNIARDGAGAVYISTAAGGVWKTTNQGLSWTNLFENAGTQPTGAIAVDPANDQVLWAGTGDFVEGCEGYFGIGLLRSGDGGATWEPRNGTGSSTLDDLSTFSSVVVDALDSDHLVVGGTIRGCSSGVQQNGGLYTSDDAGLTWTARIANTAVHQVAQDPQNRSIWWAATAQGVYKSTNNAVTWTKQTASGLPSTNTGRTELAIAPSSGNHVYVLFADQGFWRTTNGGGSWTQMSSGSSACDGQCWYNMTLAVHRTDPNIVYRGTILLFKSTDGGANWSQLINGWGGGQQVHQDIQALLVDPTVPDGIYVGSDGGMWRSTDGGASFQNMNATLPLFLFYAIDSQEGNPAVVCGGAQDNSSLVRTTEDVWDLQAVTGDGFVCQIDRQNPNYAYITSYPSGGYPSVSRSATGVLGSFQDITGPGSGITSGDRISWVTPYAVDPNDGNVLLLGTHRAYRSTNRGTSWVQTGPPDMTRGGTLIATEFNRSDSRVAYMGSSDGKVYRSTDNGASWTDITADLPQASVNDIGGDPADPDRALATLGGFNRAHLYEWTAASGAWTPIGDGLPNVPANTVLLKTAGEVFVGTDVGVFRSLDGGHTFEPFMNGLHQGLVVTDLKFDRLTNTLTAGTYGRGAYQVSVAPPGPMILFDGVEQPLVEADGDGDEHVEPGETWSVRPLLRNAGGIAALGVTARLATATAGVRIEGDDTRAFGDLAPGAAQPPAAAFVFAVEPSFACGTAIVFDVVDVRSSGAEHPDRPDAFSIEVVDSYGPPIPANLLTEDFDPAPAGWTHERINVQDFNCLGAAYKDEWRLATKDAAHGPSYHAGKGPGQTYGTFNNAWLYHAGKDSTNGPGLLVTPGAYSARLTIAHWYRTENGRDGGLVAVDAIEDGQDVFVPLVPAGGYPGTLATGNCNAQGGRAAFTGNSNGWVTSTFDLSPYVGRRIYLAFVFGSDRRSSLVSDEGWYVDDVRVDTETLGEASCDVTAWAGTVAGALFARGAGDSIEASWPAACNAAGAPGQLYSIQAGDLAALAASGTYTHTVVGADCARTSPASFSPGSGSRYFLVVPNLDGREGGVGTASDGSPRPQTDASCGTRREASCP